MASKFSEISSEQVKAQKNRLIAARDLDESEKRMYIKVLTMHGYHRRQVSLVRESTGLPSGMAEIKTRRILREKAGLQAVSLIWFICFCSILLTRY